jgi:MFS superfamily sulfate permease-like transporter
VGGSFSRSALNDEVGGTSPVVALVVGSLVGMVLKLASSVPIFFYLPQNALSAVVIASLLNLMDTAHFIFLCRFDRKDALLWLAAFLGVLFLGVEIGILVAIITSLAMVVVETIFAPAPLLGLVPGNSRRAYRSVQQYPEAAPVPGVAVMRVEAPLLFFNAPSVCARLRALVHRVGDEDSAEARTRAVVLDLSNVPYCDSAFLDEFGELVAFFKREGVLLALANPNSNVLHKLTITPLLTALNSQFGEPHDWVFLTVSDAVNAVLRFEPSLRSVKLPVPLADDE